MPFSFSLYIIIVLCYSRFKRRRRNLRLLFYSWLSIDCSC